MQIYRLIEDLSSLVCYLKPLKELKNKENPLSVTYRVKNFGFRQPSLLQGKHKQQRRC